MGLSWADLEERVRKLSTEFRDSGDRIYKVRCPYCRTVLGMTKVGRHRGAKKEVGFAVLKQIPRQLKVDGNTWRDIAGCTKSLREYLEARGHESCIPEDGSGPPSPV